MCGPLLTANLNSSERCTLRLGNPEREVSSYMWRWRECDCTSAADRCHEPANCTDRFITCEEFLGQPRNCQLLKRNFCLSSWHELQIKFNCLVQNMAQFIGDQQFYLRRFWLDLNFFFCAVATQRGLGPPQFWGFWITRNDTPQSVGFPWRSDQLVAETYTW
jgi:hypothetical protein